MKAAANPITKLAGSLLTLALSLFGFDESAHSFETVSLAVDENPASGVFETTLIAVQADIDVGEDAFADTEDLFAFKNGPLASPTVPGPEIRVALGDVVIVHFQNQLPLPTTIHWHGIELNNESDGTAATQNEVPVGGAFDYQFRVTRPGVFWYHPHIMPTDQNHKGLHGSLIVEDPYAQTLTGLDVLPAITETLVLADLLICQGTEAEGPCEEKKCEGGNDPGSHCSVDADCGGGGTCSGGNCGPLGNEACDAGEIPFVQPDFACRGRSRCFVDEAATVLVNGRVPEPGGTPGAPAPTAGFLDVQFGEGVRFQAVNASIARYFRLSARRFRMNGEKLMLYRIGGEGGLLDEVRLEGGLLTGSSLHTQFEPGELVLGPGDRADFVVLPSAPSPLYGAAILGDVTTIYTTAYDRHGRDLADLPDEPLVHVRIASSPPGSAYSIAEGDDLRIHAAIADPIQQLPQLTLPDPLEEPRCGNGGDVGSCMTVDSARCNETLDCPTGGECIGGRCLAPPVGSTNKTIALRQGVASECTFDAQCESHVCINGTCDTWCDENDDHDWQPAEPLCSRQNDCTIGKCRGDGAGPTIDGVRGRFDESAEGPGGVPLDFTEFSHAGASRFARIGDLLEFDVKNETNAHHPFHLHGFSFQPIAFVGVQVCSGSNGFPCHEDRDCVEFGQGTTCSAGSPGYYDLPYNEFVDNFDIPRGQTLRLRVRLEDRPTKADTFAGGLGGAAGRWVFHCHIFSHAGLGMISELVVMPDTCAEGASYRDHTDQVEFEASLGGAAEVFETSSLSGEFGGNGFSGYGNGHDFGPFTWESVSLPGQSPGSDIDLRFGNGADSGHDGTLIVDAIGAAPGGWGGISSPADDDDYQLRFNPPVMAAGLLIGNNRIEPNESIDYFDDHGELIARYRMPGGDGSEGDGFVGLEVCPGERPIGSIVVREGQELNDDTFFNDVVYLPATCSDVGRFVYRDQGPFQDALAGEEGFFETSSLSGSFDGAGWVGHSNGFNFGPFFWDSLASPGPAPGSDIVLRFANGVSSGHQGTLLIDAIGASPLGWGTVGTVADDDDYKLTFTTPMQSAGLMILDNDVEPGETIEFRDVYGQTITSMPLGGAGSGEAGLRYVGLNMCPGEPAIGSIVSTLR